MLTREDLNDSIRETINLMKSDIDYFLSENTWREIDNCYQDKGWAKSLRLERIIKSNGYFAIYWNRQEIYRQNIELVTATDLAFALTLAGAFAFAFTAGTFAGLVFAIIEGNITEHKDTNILLRYKTIKEEKVIPEENSYLEIGD